MGSATSAVSLSPAWARLYLGYERRIPNHPGKRKLLSLLLRGVSRARPQPFAWRMQNGAMLAISPAEGLDFAWTVGWTCFQTGRWEPHVERCIRDVLRPGDTAIDVGANLGYFTAVMAQSVGGRGEVWAFEPVPATFDRLRLAVSLNGFGQVVPRAMGLGEAEGAAEIAFDPRYAGSASFHGERSPGTARHLVPVRRLDDVLTAGTAERTRLIKIDVEGHELAVLRGARRTIEQAQPRIIFEFTQSLAQRGGWTLPELGETIASCGDYRFFEIGETELEVIPDLATYAPSPGGYGADLLAVPAAEAAT